MIKILLSLFICLFTIQAKDFYSIGVANTVYDYNDKVTNFYTTTKSKTLTVEYGFDNMETYRLYFDGNLNNMDIGIGVMAEYAQRYHFLPSWLVAVVGIPTISFGLGAGYNITKIQNESIKSTSFNMNFAYVLDYENYILKIGTKMKDYSSSSVKNFDFDLRADIKYIMLQVNF